MFRARCTIASLLLAAAACRGASRNAAIASVVHGEIVKGAVEHRTPNELGRIPILEYHLLGDSDSRWHVERNHTLGIHDVQGAGQRVWNARHEHHHLAARQAIH